MNNVSIKKMGETGNDFNYYYVALDGNAVSSVSEYWNEKRRAEANPVEDASIDSAVPNTPQVEPSEGSNIPVTANTSISPFNAGGKLFFTLEGVDYVCSAQFCGDRNLILTAAHCIKKNDSDSFAENLFFMRAYKDHGCDMAFAISAIIMDTRWDNAEGARFDYAFLLTTKCSDVSPLLYRVNKSFDNVMAIGYPSNFGGGYVMKRADDAVSKYGDHFVLMSDNGMKGGSSGGAWIEQGGNTVLGLNAFCAVQSDGRPDTNRMSYVYSPLFTSDFENLFNCAKEHITAPVRYFTLLNKGGFVARIRVDWTALNGDSGLYEEEDYHDICIHAERTLDLLGVGIPEGSIVQLNVNVVGGKDKKSKEVYILDTLTGIKANYTISGTTMSSDLVRTDYK